MIYHGSIKKVMKTGKLDGKVAIVTGATSGMGRDSAKLFAAEGAKVVITGRNEERAKEVVDDIKAEGGEAIYVIADMANLDDVEKIFDATMEEYGTVDVLFNNAGMLSMSPLMDLTIEEWNRVFNVNVTSALRLTQLVAPVMKEKGKGTIVNTCSVASFGAHHGFAAYVDSKHAMMGLTKSIAWELGPEIRCNGIAPGLIHTAMVDSIGGPGALQQMIDQCPVKRHGVPEDIATVALFLASDDSSFIDGQIIKVDGGFEI
ncbi:SDR family NAD(P)-dependent oxidoreductase [uncultured Methanobrevibacter sp.]|uniref:SDR family NAD(P)-dependent oxidoreductase n=1 Tax=uncultured Methanobrevibacter sp. TaxID=253161 RepID=UPI0025F5BC7F|nr:glucose 1-dehydrogenase [uncultured Methanobrevibacter sp.]